MVCSDFIFNPLWNTKPKAEASKGVLNNGCFSTKSLAAVLEIILQRLDIECEEWESHSKILLKVLATTGHELQLSSCELLFSNVINAILDSYSEWNHVTAQSLIATMDVAPNSKNYLVYCPLVAHGTRLHEISYFAECSNQLLTRDSTSPNLLLVKTEMKLTDPIFMPVNLHQPAIIEEILAHMMKLESTTPQLSPVDLQQAAILVDSLDHMVELELTTPPFSPINLQQGAFFVDSLDHMVELESNSSVFAPDYTLQTPIFLDIPADINVMDASTTPISLSANPPTLQAPILLDIRAHIMDMSWYDNRLAIIDVCICHIEGYVDHCKMNPADEEEKKVRVIPIEGIYSWSLNLSRKLTQTSHIHMTLAKRLYRQTKWLTSITAGIIRNAYIV